MVQAAACCRCCWQVAAAGEQVEWPGKHTASRLPGRSLEGRRAATEIHGWPAVTGISAGEGGGRERGSDDSAAATAFTKRRMLAAGGTKEEGRKGGKKGSEATDTTGNGLSNERLGGWKTGKEEEEERRRGSASAYPKGSVGAVAVRTACECRWGAGARSKPRLQRRRHGGGGTREASRHLDTMPALQRAAPNRQASPPSLPAPPPSPRQLACTISLFAHSTATLQGCSVRPYWMSSRLRCRRTARLAPGSVSGDRRVVYTSPLDRMSEPLY